MQKRSTLAISLIIAMACATGTQRPANMPRPELRAAVVSTPFFGSGLDAPLSLDIEISNLGSVPIMVRSIRVSTPGMVQFAIRPYTRILQETLPAGQSRVFNLTTMAFSGSDRLSPTEPLNLRAEAYFVVNGNEFRELYNLVNVPIE